MAHPKVSDRSSKYISFALFFAGLIIVTYFRTWWPGIMLVIGIPLAVRQYLMGRRYDMYVSLFVFIGVFLTVQFNIAWEIILPVLFTLGGIYLFCREFLEGRSEPEEEESKNKEIEEDEKK